MRTRNHPSNDITLQQDSLYSADESKLIHSPHHNPYDDSVMISKSTAAMTDKDDGNSFNEMTKQKYLFPEELLHNKNWFIEIQKPLAITVQDIKRDFTKFVKDFPIEIIPHQSDTSMYESQLKRGQNLKTSRQSLKTSTQSL